MLYLNILVVEVKQKLGFAVTANQQVALLQTHIALT